MAIEDKKIIYRVYITALMLFLFALAITVKLVNIQIVEGDYYRKLAKERTVKNFVIPANKGNIYSSDGSLLATSIPNYTIRFDAMAPTDENFQNNIQPLADSLAKMFNKPSQFYKSEFIRARNNENRYYLVARNLSYTDYQTIKSFPLFNLGTYKGGLITEQKTVREHPIGLIAERTIGYERKKPDGTPDGKGIEWAFRDYLNGKDGNRWMQKMAKNQWKPIRDENEVEPQDGYDIISTIDVYIQDIAHHSLLQYLTEYEAEHGCVIVMETHTGEIKAISNLGRVEDGSYAETINYAVTESHEPGSTFKLVDLIALFEDKLVDSSQVFDSYGGIKEYFGKQVRDSKKGGYGRISLAKAFEKSSNTILVQAVYNNYKNEPQRFINHIKRLKLDQPLGLQIKGEGKPKIPKPGDSNWYKTTLPWMAYGYGVALTPLQTLTLYNAVANNGEMVKPLFVKEIKEWNKTIKKFDKEVLNPKIASTETLNQVKAILENVVKRGTAEKLYSPNFSMAGKTGTAQANYGKNGGKEKHYISSFVGYFPADKPKYSCIVVIHQPSVEKGYYGGEVSGPVFKRIAQKVFTDVPFTNKIKRNKQNHIGQDKDFEKFYAKVNREYKTIPNVRGMAGMDAVSLLENLKLKVKVIGIGKVKKQSIEPGTTLKKNETIILELS